MVRVDAAHSAEKVLRDLGVELIQREELFTLDNVKLLHRNRRRDCPAPAANGTVATPRVLDSFWEFQFQYYAAAMASRPVTRLEFGVANDSVSLHPMDPSCGLTVTIRTLTPI